MRENSSLSAPDPRSWQQHREEAEALLAQPIQPGAGTTRVGKSLGLRITPLLSQDQVQLGVSFFPVNLVSARGDQEDEENQADQLALRAFLDGLQAAELPTRLAACEALGQLGNPAARPALEAATQDENRLIQTAARKALSALDASRLKTADLSGISLLLWQQVKHLWKPVKATQTDQHGEGSLCKPAGRSGVSLAAPHDATQDVTARPGFWKSNTYRVSARNPGGRESRNRCQRSPPIAPPGS